MKTKIKTETDVEFAPYPTKERLEMMCKCGGKFGLDFERCGVFHTMPMCKDFEELDVNELVKQKGELAKWLYKMEAHPEA